MSFAGRMWPAGICCICCPLLLLRVYKENTDDMVGKIALNKKPCTRALLFVWISSWDIHIATLEQRPSKDIATKKKTNLTRNEKMIFEERQNIDESFLSFSDSCMHHRLLPLSNPSCCRSSDGHCFVIFLWNSFFVCLIFCKHLKIWIFPLTTFL